MLMIDQLIVKWWKNNQTINNQYTVIIYSNNTGKLFKTLKLND